MNEASALSAVSVPPFAGLTPNVVLNALDSLGVATTGTQLALNSYENRVFQIGIEDPDGSSGFVIAKFYRPGRWNDAQILEEHAFTAELAAAEVPVVPARRLNGCTLHHVSGFRVAVFDRRGGRAPNLDDASVCEWLGRFLGRIHAIGATRRFEARPGLDVQTFGVEPRAYLLEHDWVPIENRGVYADLAQRALDDVQRAFDRAGTVRVIRVHGDVHEGNVLWSDSAGRAGPNFVDFDDARMAPAVQDFWMLLGRDRAEQTARLTNLLAGYEDFAEFDRRELLLIEALRTLRLLHYSAWIARRWSDPAFPAAFPWFSAPRYWEGRILELREQIAAMQEPVLVV